MLQISVETVRTYLKLKKNPLPASRLGREYRVDPEDLHKWMQSRKNVQDEEP
jgi:excisionase family DNA binding protein